jgi:hypothetical protein
MLSRLRTTWLAGSGALILVLAVAGAAIGAPVPTSSEEPAPDEAAPLVVDTALTFEDADGDSIDDDCDAEVTADAEAAAAAAAAVDANADGVISVAEAAQSERTGGANCNHGGYVSNVAQEQCDAVVDDGDPAEGAAEVEPTDECDEDEAAAPEETEEDEAKAECVPVAAPTFDPEIFTGPGAFGAYVSSVAASDAVGGKNCNHGGAVSEAVNVAKEAARAERDAAKAERQVQRDAAKAERQVQRDAAKAERAAAKGQGSGKSKGQGQGQGQGQGT